MTELFKVVRNELRIGKDYPEVTEKNALPLSIKKWEFIPAWIKKKQTWLYDGDGATCALCQNYDAECTGCPVAQCTGRGNCDGTPYWDYARAENKPASVGLAAAKAELAFLKSLQGGRK